MLIPVPDYPASLFLQTGCVLFKRPIYFESATPRERHSGNPPQPCIQPYDPPLACAYGMEDKHECQAFGQLHTTSDSPLRPGSFHISTFRMFSVFQRSFNFWFSLASRNSRCKYMTANTYAPNFLTCTYQQLINRSYQQAKALIINSDIFKLLISTKKGCEYLIHYPGKNQNEGYPFFLRLLKSR
jgi:hypothetical protein